MCLQISVFSEWSPFPIMESKQLLYIIHFYVFFPQLEKKEVTPPFKPQISDDYGLENFDTQFTNEPVQLTPDDE